MHSDLHDFFLAANQLVTLIMDQVIDQQVYFRNLFIYCIHLCTIEYCCLFLPMLQNLCPKWLKMNRLNIIDLSWTFKTDKVQLIRKK